MDENMSSMNENALDGIGACYKYTFCDLVEMYKELVIFESRDTTKSAQFDSHVCWLYSLLTKPDAADILNKFYSLGCKCCVAKYLYYFPTMPGWYLTYPDVSGAIVDMRNLVTNDNHKRVFKKFLDFVFGTKSFTSRPSSHAREDNGIIKFKPCDGKCSTYVMDKKYDENLSKRRETKIKKKNKTRAENADSGYSSSPPPLKPTNDMAGVRTMMDQYLKPLTMASPSYFQTPLARARGPPPLIRNNVGSGGFDQQKLENDKTIHYLAEYLQPLSPPPILEKPQVPQPSLSSNSIVTNAVVADEKKIKSPLVVDSRGKRKYKKRTSKTDDEKIRTTLIEEEEESEMGKNKKSKPKTSKNTE